MDPNDAGGDAPGDWSLDDVKRYLTLQRFLPRNGGLFGSGWAQFMANQENAGVGAAPLSFMPNTQQKPSAIPPWATPPILPQAPADASPFGQPQLNVYAALLRRPAGVAPPPSIIAGGTPPKGATATVSQMGAPLGGRPVTQNVSAAKSSPPIDPSRTDVFQRGADGKLHPVPGWRTTGPFDFDTWSHNIDWNGVGRDLGNIGTWAATLLTGGEALAAPGALEALGLDGILGSGVKGAIHAHHVEPMFMGGRAEQKTYDLIAQFHRKFHSELQAALKEGGFPRVGGKGGSRDDWMEFFKANPEARDRAVEILRRVSRDFDIERGTSILPALEKELRLGRSAAGVPPVHK